MTDDEFPFANLEERANLISEKAYLKGHARHRQNLIAITKRVSSSQYQGCFSVYFNITGARILLRVMKQDFIK